ncbi:hypothetical protein mRhiFer1_007939 [Rhinolophus ferrumequinum]|uniref:KRAB-related domain-containing protein n=1 Tax=Rhinolophus ferrumequinum TaxID=59479 RepID=A0A7J8AVC6_RHIFE|nr:hypothetical protein mRhiFer1_007939 [Rhinolophus ferrumequinum]
MDRGSSSAETHREDAQESQEKHEAFDDISKYFSKKQWAKLGDLQKRTYLYMKRKYDHMTRLGLSTNRPYFMRSQNQTTNAPESDAHEDQSPGNQDENPQAASDVEWTEHEKASVSQMTRTTRFWPSVDVNMVRVGENRRWPAPHCLPYWCLYYHAACGISSLIINNCDS